MDVDVVRSSGEALKRYARELAEVEQNIDSLSRRLRKVWAGQDAERFEYVWHSRYRVRIQKIVTDVAAMGDSALHNAREQELASQGSGMAAAAAFVAAGPNRASNKVPESGVGNLHEKWDRLLTMLALSDSAYGEAKPPRGWEVVDHREDPVSGFSATVYRSSEGKYVMAFAGTNSKWDSPGNVAKSVIDWRNNAAGLVGPTAQDAEAIAYAKAFKKSLGSEGADLEFTGHSLGGRLAALAALATGNEATTFNTDAPADLARITAWATGLGQPGQVTAVSVTGEALNGLRDTAAASHAVTGVGVGVATAYGTRIELFDPEYKNPIDAHNAPAIDRALRYAQNRSSQ